MARNRLGHLVPPLIASAALACLAGEAIGQSDRPSAANRLVKVWDFEDRVINGFIADFPQDWFSGNPAPPQPERPGFPFWNKPGFSSEHAASGESCVVLPTKGGSTSVRLARSALVVMPGSDYLVTARVRTDGLVHARARITTRYVRSTVEINPRTGDRTTGYIPIDETTVESSLILSEGEWTPIQLRVDAHPEAEFLEIELLLLQPEQFLAELRDAPVAEQAQPTNPALVPPARDGRLIHEVIRVGQLRHGGRVPDAASGTPHDSRGQLHRCPPEARTRAAGLRPDR